MSSQANCFTSFKESIDCYALPEQFTFPFYYQPHPLCLLAAKELQQHIQTQKDWQHNFTVSGNNEPAIGKMFGVLLVQNNKGELGYLSAFSGKLAEKNHLPGFVPPVFDMLDENSFFLLEQSKINQINDRITELEQNPKILASEVALKSAIESSIAQISVHREKIIAGRKNRKQQRLAAETELTAEDNLKLKDQLGKESIKEKFQLRDLNLYWNERIQVAEHQFNQATAELDALKKQRKKLSAALQKNLFKHYRFLNSKGEEKSLFDIFKATTQLTPPAGSGECAAPKLLHYAFKHNLKPLAMAEFWWGDSPKSEIRQHGNFYPACNGKCKPILAHMLEGVSMDENPLLTNPGEETSIDIIFQDEVMLVINKPPELLSVSGKNIEDSVYFRMKQRYPQATGPLTVHRLDMSTSGLMLIALNKEVHKILQKQFINRSIKKRYVALLEGQVKQDKGIIDLPLRLDIDDRPRQLVCYEYGKPAKTEWEVIQRKNNQTRVHFYPVTGRTHQLRVHSAHTNGLNAPIVGDDIYGNRANRLHLHADFIAFNHPLTRELMQFQIDAEF